MLQQVGNCPPRPRSCPQCDAKHFDELRASAWCKNERSVAFKIHQNTDPAGVLTTLPNVFCKPRLLVIDRLKMVSSAAALLWVYIVQYKREKITRVLSCLFTATLLTTKITRNMRRRLTSYIKSHATTIFLYQQHGVVTQPTTTDAIKIMTSPHYIVSYVMTIYSVFSHQLQRFAYFRYENRHWKMPCRFRTRYNHVKHSS